LVGRGNSDFVGAGLGVVELGEVGEGVSVRLGVDVGDGEDSVGLGRTDGAWVGVGAGWLLGKFSGAGVGSGRTIT
jgi:hypothetical protein